MVHATRPTPAVRLLALLSAGLLAAGVLSGCTAWASASAPPGTTSTSTAPAAASASRSEIGNGRPLVNYDGPLVQRRVVLAVHTRADADLPTLRAGVDQRADGADLRLADISPDVLPAGVLEQAVPQLTLLLPAGSTEDDARGLIDASTATQPAQYFVLTVLVHDLVFEVDATDPGALADAIAREGILSDALGNYETTAGTDTLGVSYLGTLLGDEMVDSVRSAMARPAGTTPRRVAVLAGTPGGTGVDVAAEPIPQPVVLAGGTSHEVVSDAPVAEAEVDATPLGPWLAYWIGLAVVLGVTVLLAGWSLVRRRRRLRASAFEPERPDPESP